MASDEQQIREVIATWMSATAAGDLAQILNLMDEDVVFLVMGQPPMRGRDAFAVGFKKALEKFKIESTSNIQEIEVTGDWAYCWNDLQVTMTPHDEGEPTVRRGNVLSVFRKSQEGNWVLFRDANLLGG
jgi:uncharacterized protein (TIGR02246 family)